MNQLFGGNLPGYPPASVIIILSIWSVFWKGIALWRAAGAKQKNWFLVILIVNLFGIIEIIYLFKYAKHRLTLEQMKSWIPGKN